jgi:hypothetical protein
MSTDSSAHASAETAASRCFSPDFHSRFKTLTIDDNGRNSISIIDRTSRHREIRHSQSSAVIRPDSPAPANDHERYTNVRNRARLKKLRSIVSGRYPGKESTTQKKSDAKSKYDKLGIKHGFELS